MSVNAFPSLGDSLLTGVTDSQVGSFLEKLQAGGYPKRTLRLKRHIVVFFARWTRDEQIALNDLGDSHITTFVRPLARQSKWRVRFELSTLRAFLEHLRAEAGLPSRVAVANYSPTTELGCRYVDYLRSERGLADNSVCVYSHYIRDFLADLSARSGGGSPPMSMLDALTVQQYLLGHMRGRSSEYCRLLATALRSFLRFLFLRAQTSIDLSFCVPMVRRWAQATVPAFLSTEEVDRVLSFTDRSTLGGLRDHAILLLLARLGLRAGEIVALELSDIRWRAGEIVVRGKGRVTDRLPLLSDVGEALVCG